MRGENVCSEVDTTHPALRRLARQGCSRYHIRNPLRRLLMLAMAQSHPRSQSSYLTACSVTLCLASVASSYIGTMPCGSSTYKHPIRFFSLRIIRILLRSNHQSWTLRGPPLVPRSNLRDPCRRSIVLAMAQKHTRPSFPVDSFFELSDRNPFQKL